MYTRCPNCDSQFEITQEYLDIANGKVRCGNCEHIFNALENLYEQSPESEVEAEPEVEVEAEPEAEAEPDIEQASESQATHDAPSDSEQSQAGDYTFTAPSIDIKAKMERIAASLSAATQELKTARKSSIFEQETDAQSVKEVPSTVVTEPTANEVSEPLEEPSPAGFPSDSDKPTEVEESLEAPGDSTKDPIAEPLATEQTPSDEAPAAVEDDLEILQVDEAGDQLAAEPADTVEVDESLDNTEKAAIEEAVTEIVADDDMVVDDILTEDTVPEEQEQEELELIDFSKQAEEEDSYSEPVSDFTTRKVDQDDIDILKSLINEPEESDNLRNEGLLDELDNINQTLSDEADSLDEEFSGSDSDLEDIDNGDDLLAELEQLEKDFINNEQLPDNASLDDALGGPNDFQQLPSDYDEIDEASLTDQAPATDESLSVETDIDSEIVEKKSEKLADDEVVPSFLTQSNAQASNPRAMFAWLAGTIALVLVLAAQYLHVNSINLAQNSTFRPFLESLCPMTGCALPLIKAPTKIITTDHDVRTHPKINNALEIQLSFKNKATFKQGYPTLEIIFSNSRGEVVARRKFTPDEYLTADIQYAHGMKSNQSQDVRLKIVDPDPSSLLSFQFNYY